MSVFVTFTEDLLKVKKFVELFNTLSSGWVFLSDTGLVSVQNIHAFEKMLREMINTDVPNVLLTHLYVRIVVDKAHKHLVMEFQAIEFNLSQMLLDHKGFD